MQCRFGGIVPESKITRRNPPVRLNRSGFEDEHARARCRHGAQVHEVPIGRFTIDRAVLAHRRNHDSVFEGQLAEGGRGEECTHRFKNRIELRCLLMKGFSECIDQRIDLSRRGDEGWRELQGVNAESDIEALAPAGHGDFKRSTRDLAGVGRQC